jgi:hypothetical protein
MSFYERSESISWGLAGAQADSAILTALYSCWERQEGQCGS